MKKRIKQGIAFLLVIMMVVTLFAGCGASVLLEEPAELASAVSNMTYAAMPQSFTSAMPLQGASPPAAIRDVFPDEALAEIVALALGETVDDVATQEDLNQLQELNINHRGVASLEGVQYLRGLVTLRAWDNRISDLSPLSGLASLVAVNLGHNQISDLSPLSELRIFQLVLEHNQISDVAPLASVSAELWLSDNQIRDITPIAWERSVRVDRNQITDFSSVGGFTGLLRCLEGRDQQITLEPMLRADVISIASMIDVPWGSQLISYHISDGGVYENGMITWSGLTTQESVSFSWHWPMTSANAEVETETAGSDSNQRPQCNHCCVGWHSWDSPMIIETSGTVTIPLRSPSPIRLSQSGTVEFRPQSVSAEPSSLMTTVRNTAATWSDPLMVRLTGANASSFEFTHLQCSIPQTHRPLRDIWTGVGTSFIIPNIEPGGSTEFRLRTVPGLAAGTHIATVTMVGRGISESFDLVIEVR